MRGVTLVELIVTLALVGVILGLTSVAIASLGEAPNAAQRRELEQGRRKAIRTGLPVVLTVADPDTALNHGPRTTHLLFLPDGRAIGPGLDPLTGATGAGR